MKLINHIQLEDVYESIHGLIGEWIVFFVENEKILRIIFSAVSEG